MYEVKVLNKFKKIAYLKWEGIVKAEEVASANEELLKIYKDDFHSNKFYLLVDASKLMMFKPETKQLIIEQQKLFGPKLIKVADVIKGNLTKAQLKKANDDAELSIVTRFDDFNEALRFLETQAK